MPTIGYNTIGTSSVTFDAAVSTESTMQAIAKAYAPASGDTATTFNIYIQSGTGSNSTVKFGLWDLTGVTTNPSASTLLISSTIVITTANKATPGWYSVTPNWSLTSYVGKTVGLAIAAVDTAAITVAADSGGSSSTANSGGGDVFPSPTWGTTTFSGTANLSYYMAVTSGGGGGGNRNKDLLTLGVAMAPLAWIIDRRNKIALERRFEQDQKSRIFLPTYRKSR